MEKIKNIRKRLRHQRSVRRRKLGLSTPTQIICVSFIAVIALGTLLLTLPIASRHGRLDVLNAINKELERRNAYQGMRCESIRLDTLREF